MIHVKEKKQELKLYTLRITVKEKAAFKKKRVCYARRKMKIRKLIDYLQSELQTSSTHGLAYIANTEIHWLESKMCRNLFTLDLYIIQWYGATINKKPLHVLEAAYIMSILNDRRDYRLPRIFWAACFGISCAIIFVLLSAQYSRLVEAPIVNNVEKDYLNWNVSYPTIVLCPVRKIDDEILTQYVNETLNRTGHNLESYYSSIISASLEALNVVDLPKPEILELIQPQDYAKIAADLFIKLDNRTLKTLLNWPLSIDATMTEMGMCHIINSNVAILDDPTKWSDSSVAYAKKNIELSLHDIDYFVQIVNYAEAYKVYTLSPDEVILSGAASLTFDTEGFLSFGVQITSTRASEDLKYIPLHLRKCRQGWSGFTNETTSRRYPIYSYNRCLLECRIKMVLKLCDCIPHFYKPLDGERICSLADLECVFEYKKEILKLSASNDTMEKFDNTNDIPRSFRDCGCLGNCEEDVFKNDHETFLPQETMNRLRVSVSAFPKVRIKREIMFSFYDIFLRSGGVVNLCIGTSVISIMELLLTALRIPIYEIMQIVKGVWRRYKRSQIPRLSYNKKVI